ncbi:helix-turn-helix domain-containing protein [Paramicrobacterium fandaimingii]|uniref:helix-turn-helix domain-containing protein n=1 Tax=Paramicrobacterium fandaimingii TaxID=2708079 RepID=UPI00141F9472|nr:helix-turn-helix transcriptional regulator [Microbacterium fandaimingii]
MAEIVEMQKARQQRELRRGPERPERSQPETLWREALGERLREHRGRRGEKLTDTAKAAGVSPQYLSEVERGRKEPSSEMIAAIAGALETSLIELTSEVAAGLRRRGATNSASDALLLAA